jgi:hypothetical protein
MKLLTVTENVACRSIGSPIAPHLDNTITDWPAVIPRVGQSRRLQDAGTRLIHPLLIEEVVDLPACQFHSNQAVAERLNRKELSIGHGSGAERSALMPPGFIKAKSVPSAARCASAIRLPSDDSPAGFSARDHFRSGVADYPVDERSHFRLGLRDQFCNVRISV